jgi:hypothetical protein
MCLHLPTLEPWVQGAVDEFAREVNRQVFVVYEAGRRTLTPPDP